MLRFVTKNPQTLINQGFQGVQIRFKNALLLQIFVTKLVTVA